MKLAEFDYKLPKDLIAQCPVSPRDSSRLLVLSRKSGDISHSRFFEIDKYLKKGDIIILNNSKVIPARLLGKKETGGKAEVLLIKRIDNSKINTWECLIKTKNPKITTKIYFCSDLEGKIVKILKNGVFQVEFNASDMKFRKLLYEIGETPLPPYIGKSKNVKIKNQYQTVYADPKKEGSIAAPTAGLHFTNRLMKKLKDKGIRFEYISLHVGLGTFQPVKTDKIEDHSIHSEFVEVNNDIIHKIIKAKNKGNRIIACGTTSARTLEAVIPQYLNENKKIKPYSDDVSIYIYPGYKFKVIDGLITNFHLPKTTLLMLISAFMADSKGKKVVSIKDQKKGVKLIKNAYKEAINNKYRFYSFGDSMFIN